MADLQTELAKAKMVLSEREAAEYNTKVDAVTERFNALFADETKRTVKGALKKGDKDVKQFLVWSKTELGIDTDILKPGHIPAKKVVTKAPASKPAHVKLEKVQDMDCESVKAELAAGCNDPNRRGRLEDRLFDLERGAWKDHMEARILALQIEESDPDNQRVHRGDAAKLREKMERMLRKGENKKEALTEAQKQERINELVTQLSAPGATNRPRVWYGKLDELGALDPKTANTFVLPMLRDDFVVELGPRFVALTALPEGAWFERHTPASKAGRRLLVQTTGNFEAFMRVEGCEPMARLMAAYWAARDFAGEISNPETLVEIKKVLADGQRALKDKSCLLPPEGGGKSLLWTVVREELGEDALLAKITATVADEADIISLKYMAESLQAICITDAGKLLALTCATFLAQGGNAEDLPLEPDAQPIKVGSRWVATMWHNSAEGVSTLQLKHPTTRNARYILDRMNGKRIINGTIPVAASSLPGKPEMAVFIVKFDHKVDIDGQRYVARHANPKLVEAEANFGGGQGAGLLLDIQGAIEKYLGATGRTIRHASLQEVLGTPSSRPDPRGAFKREKPKVDPFAGLAEEDAGLHTMPDLEEVLTVRIRSVEKRADLSGMLGDAPPTLVRRNTPATPEGEEAVEPVIEAPTRRVVLLRGGKDAIPRVANGG